MSPGKTSAFYMPALLQRPAVRQVLTFFAVAAAIMLMLLALQLS
jgi:hypothetical protein